MQAGEAWYRKRHVAGVQFVGVAADPPENLDFGLAGSTEDDLIVEPDEPAAER